MAQAGQTPIQLYYSNTSGSKPANTNLIIGELAINVPDGKLFYKDVVGTVNTIASTAATAGYFPTITFTQDGTRQNTAAAPWNYSNASFLLANAANNLAQTGYTQANAATDSAQSGYIQANAATVSAQAAYNHANIAYTSVGAGYIQANAATVSAQAGFDQANASNNLATSGYTKANAATISAQAAYNKANAAMSIGTTNTNNFILGTVVDVHTIRFDEDSGFAVTEMSPGVAKVAINSTFKYWEVDGQTTIVAEGLDTIKFVGTGGVAITTGPTAPKTLTIDTSAVFNHANNVESFAGAAYNQANVTNSYAVASYDKANTVGISSNAAFNKANTAVDSTIYLQSVNDYQNNFLGGAATFYTASFDQANAATESAASAYEKANSGYDIAVGSQGVNNAQNTTISAISSYSATGFARANAATNSAQAAFNKANNVTAAYDQANAATNSAQSGYEQANAANMLAAASYEQANVTIYLNDVNSYQNTRTSAVENYSQFSFTKANAVGNFADSSYAKANAVGTYSVASYTLANAVSELTTTSFAQANAAATSAQAGYTHANNAYNHANTKFASAGGFITGYANVSSNVSVGTYIDFNTTAKPSNREGRVFYDTDQKALAYYNESDMTGQLLQEAVVRVWNNTASIISDGRAVIISGASSANGFPSVVLADASTYETSEVIGLTTTTIPVGGYGYVTQQGKVNGLNTSLFSEGDEVYLSDGPTGTWQTTAPADPSIAVRVGIVANSDAVDGSILVDVTFRDGVNKTTGAVIFAYDESLHQDPSNFFYDHINKRLGIGTDVPQANLHVVGDAIFSSNVTITGNLSISNAQSISTSELTVGGNTIVLNSGVTGTPTTNASIIVNRGTSTNTYITWDESIDEWIMYEGSGTPGHILHSEKTAHTWDQYASMAAYEKLSHPIGATLANTTNEHAKGAYITANSALAVATGHDASLTSAYAQANAATNSATSSYTQANAGTNLATSSYTQANAANDLAQTGFTKANAATNSAQSGYNQANAATNSAQAAYNVANVTIQLQYTNDVQNTAITALDEYSQAGYGFANTLSNYAGSAYGKANAVGTYATAGFTKANSATQSAQASFDKANTAYDYAAYAAETNLTQNTNIGYVDTYATAGYAQANAANNLATSGYAVSNTNTTAITLLQGVDVYQNTRMSAIESFAVAGYNVANTTIYLQSVNDVQNTNIIALSSYAVSGYAQANAADTLATAAFEAANTGTTAVAAFEQANAANVLATSGYSQANAATVSAQAAYDAANTAVSAGATYAYQQANAATQSAQAAYNFANSINEYTVASYGQSNTATTYAIGSSSLAQAAYNKANSISGGTITTYIYTAANTAPLGPIVGDKWYDTTDDILYEYISDGVSEYWIDIGTPSLTTENTSITVTNTYTGYGRSAAMAIVFGGF